jgi:hypothetical protein
MKHNFEFPKNNEEFLTMLETIGVKNTKSWVYDEFSKTKVNIFLFLWDAWDDVPNPNRAEKLLNTTISRAKQHIKMNPSQPADSFKTQSVDIFERWLKMGIDPKEIVTVMRDAHIDAIYGLLQSIDQPSDFNHGIKRYYGLYEVEMDDNSQSTINDANNPIEHDISDYLQSAMPKDQPPMPYWC